MEFIKQMKKREFIEMGLKTLASILAAFLVIILMEGMIYGIELNALKTKSKSSTIIANHTVAYCIEQSDDQYFVIYYNKGSQREWSAEAIVDSNGTLLKHKLMTKAQCEAMTTEKGIEVIMRAPTAFEFTITGTHYVVMAVCIAAVAGFFVYKFIRLAKSYKKIEDTFIKTGTIELSNI